MHQAINDVTSVRVRRSTIHVLAGKVVILLVVSVILGYFFWRDERATDDDIPFVGAVFVVALTCFAAAVVYEALGHGLGWVIGRMMGARAPDLSIPSDSSSAGR